MAILQGTQAYLNKKEVISFRQPINPNTVDQIFKTRVKSDGTVEEVRVRFYRGQQLALQVDPIVFHKGNKREDLIYYAQGTHNYLAGDDDYFVYPVVVPVEADDYVSVMVSNTDPANTYTMCVDIILDYYGGKDRIVGGVIHG